MKKYKTHFTTPTYLKKIRKHKEPYKYKILGKEIIIYPKVMSPKYDWSPKFIIQRMPNQKDKTFLEIGCGSGVISLFAYFQGAKKVVCVDINKNAVKNTKENFKKYNIKNVDILYSNVFQNIKGKFDTILFQAPYHGNRPKDILEYGVSDPNYKALRSFIGNAKNHLKKNGRVILGFSNTGNLKLLNHLIIENGFFVKERLEETNNNWTAYLYVLDPIKFMKPKQKYIYNDDYKYFKEYEDFVRKGKVLKIGSGLNYTSYFIKLFNDNITILDIVKNKNSLMKKEIQIYDGKNIPFKENYFDHVIVTYSLHHMEEPRNYLKKLIKVTKNNLIIVEETYTNWLSKFSLIINDWIINRLAGQKVKIYPKSYFKKKELPKFVNSLGFKLKKHTQNQTKLFTKEFFIFKK